MNKNIHKLSRRLSLNIMFMAIPLFILSLGILFNQSYKLIHEEVAKSTSSLLNTMHHRIVNYMSTIETATNANAWMMEKHFRPDSLKIVSKRIVELNNSVTSSSFYAAPDVFKAYGYGEMFSLHTDREKDKVTTTCDTEDDYFDRVSYTMPMGVGKACWIDPFAKQENEGGHNEATAIYCRPIWQKNRHIVGVLTADLSFERMAKMLSKGEQPYPNAYYMLLGSDGRYLIHPDSTRQFKKTIFTDTDPSENKDMITLGHEMTAGKKGTIHTHYNGKLYHVCYMPVSGTDWSLALVCPDSDVMRGFRHLGYLVMGLLCLGLLLIVLLCHHVVKQTIRPINTLIDSTQRMADGHFDEMIPDKTYEGIFGQLQNSFFTMQKALNERMGSLRQKTEETKYRNEMVNRDKQEAEHNMKEKYEFLRVVAQQMRTPLNVIMGFANVLGDNSKSEDLITDEELESINDMLKSNVISLNRWVLLMSDSTSTNAMGVLHCERVDEVSCNKISQDVIDHIYRHFPQSEIHFETELSDAVHILTNRLFLLSILIEPLYNAVHYSDGKHIVLRVTQTEENVCFTIQDKGPGIPEETLKNLSLTITPDMDNLALGTGLGLSLVSRYTSTLGGDMKIDSNYHEGFRIIIEMPK